MTTMIARRDMSVAPLASRARAYKSTENGLSPQDADSDSPGETGRGKWSREPREERQAIVFEPHRDDVLSEKTV